MGCNRVRLRLGRNEPVFGVTVQTGCVEIVELAGYCGYDFVKIDLEHGHFGLETAMNLVRAADGCGISPLVRVSDVSSGAIGKLLDSGTQGIIVPNVETGSEVHSCVGAVRYGRKRRACPTVRASRYGLIPWEEYVSASNSDVMLIVLIETPNALDSLDDILKVDGVDAVELGPFDLAQRLGVEPSCQTVRRAMENVIQKALVKGKQVMAVVGGETEGELGRAVQLHLSLGCRILSVCNDRKLITEGLKRKAAAIRLGHTLGRPGRESISENGPVAEGESSGY